jgi:hypothetical protein
MVMCVACVAAGLLVGVYAQACLGGDARLCGLGVVMAFAGLAAIVMLKRQARHFRMGR